ncbi:hypothetical protein Calhy_0420 [Caldicellulosiruptor hydrothermalis 108]|uniref:Uncharacterized protein n=1 Tax=Caldicellulosiruptor hydrothermalis (strain DSM 18901 / VKM B-2411 / 108) TaxID=632292 RepID=E4QBZ3_CALH1|nr:hypothetical protein Calhy_0420 [Caldicellulosiruptor hydrothermalis 108]
MAIFIGTVHEVNERYVKIRVEKHPEREFSGFVVFNKEFIPLDFQPIKVGDEFFIDIAVNEQFTKNLRILKEALNRHEEKSQLPTAHRSGACQQGWTADRSA